MPEKDVHFWEMPPSTRYVLNTQFCLNLFDGIAKGDYCALAKRLGISYPYVHHLRRSLYSIPQNLLVKISNLAGYDLPEVEENIQLARTRAGLTLHVKFPIMGNEIIASLVGHVFGDGSVGSKKRQFEYSNTNPNLITEVESEVKAVLGSVPSRRTSSRIVYPSIVGDVLMAFGAPQAPKLMSQNTVPVWIMNGTKLCKKAFLKALFNDDGSVLYCRSYNAKGVNLHQTRHESKSSGLIKLLSQIKELLAEFDVLGSAPRISRKYTKKDGAHIVMYINTTDYVSISNFHREIGLANGEKLSRLEKILSRPNYYNKRTEDALNSKILAGLKEDPKPTSKLAAQLGAHRQKILKKLTRLEIKGTVVKSGRTAPNRDFIWKLKEVASL